VDRELLADLLAAGFSLEAIGERVGRHPSTVGYWVARHGLDTAHGERHRSVGGLDPDRLRALADAGLSIRAIAVESGLSYSTIRYWLGRHGIESARVRRRRVIERALDEGSRRVELACPKHGLGDFVLEGRGYFRCVRCRSERVASHRRKVKARLVAEAGGRCVRCGYCRIPAALEFHHLEPAQKSFAIGSRGVARAYDEVRAEAAKCILLCSNCHAEVEAGMAVLP
jgi:transposase